MEDIEKNCLDDLEKQILNEEISYQFYEKAVNSVEFIAPQKQFKEMMWEEFNHVRALRDMYAEMVGNKQITYNAEEHGGIALPSKELNAEVALDIGIKEEVESIHKYKTLIMKYKDHKISEFFNKLLEDEKHHLSNWEKAQIEYIATKPKQSGKQEKFPSYSFTSSDIVAIGAAVKYWGKYRLWFLSKVKMLHNFKLRDSMISIIESENGYTELLGNEYFRLKGAKPGEDTEMSDSFEVGSNKKNIDNKEIIEQIINEEKACLTRFCDWVRMCANSQLAKILLEIVENKRNHLKQWVEIGAG